LKAAAGQSLELGHGLACRFRFGGQRVMGRFVAVLLALLATTAWLRIIAGKVV